MTLIEEFLSILSAHAVPIGPVIDVKDPTPDLLFWGVDEGRRYYINVPIIMTIPANGEQHEFAFTIYQVGVSANKCCEFAVGGNFPSTVRRLMILDKDNPSFDHLEKLLRCDTLIYRHNLHANLHMELRLKLLSDITTKKVSPYDQYRSDAFPLPEPRHVLCSVLVSG